MNIRANHQRSPIDLPESEWTTTEELLKTIARNSANEGFKSPGLAALIQKRFLAQTEHVSENVITLLQPEAASRETINSKRADILQFADYVCHDDFGQDVEDFLDNHFTDISERNKNELYEGIMRHLGDAKNKRKGRSLLIEKAFESYENERREAKIDADRQDMVYSSIEDMINYNLELSDTICEKINAEQANIFYNMKRAGITKESDMQDYIKKFFADTIAEEAREERELTAQKNRLYMRKNVITGGASSDNREIK